MQPSAGLRVPLFALILIGSVLRVARGLSVGIVVVCSPARTHPSSDMLWSVLGSTRLLEGLDEAPITIVADGYRTEADLESEHATRVTKRLARDPMCLSKKGIVSSNVGAAYEAFKLQLRNEVVARCLSSRVSILEMRSHQGFAMCVRHGLLAASTDGQRFALVLQHDRAFIRRLAREQLQAVLDTFDEDTQMRYVGFPSSTSKLLATRLQPQYKLGALLSARTRPLNAGLLLRPSIFWWDSNHIVHAARCLEMYEPCVHAPAVVRQAMGESGLRRMSLRRGDFIEDRLGMEQRTLLASMHARPAALLQAFDWFGCYLLEETVTEANGSLKAIKEAGVDGGLDGNGGGATDGSAHHNTPLTEQPLVCELLDSRGRASYVAHIDARGARPRQWVQHMPPLRGLHTPLQPDLRALP